MTKPAMPGHLIAVLILLVGHAAVVPRLLFVPLLVLALLSPMPFMVVLPLVLLAVLVWYVWLVYAVATRRPWALRGARVTAVGTCVLGVLGLMVAIASKTKLELGLGGGGVSAIGIGGYMLWALGRADVRGWLVGTTPAP
jgi:hypothetical protein